MSHKGLFIIKSAAKVQHFFDMTKYFYTKFTKFYVFRVFLV